MSVVSLSAGPLTMLYDNGMLRSLYCGGDEIIRRVYMGLRDRYWNTVPFSVENLQILQDDSSFAITFDAVHRSAPVRFTWHCTMTGSPSGIVTAAMDGRAETTFMRNRIGWCILHPLKECKGESCTVEHSDGAMETTAFPGETIAPRQPFTDIRSMGWQAGPGVNCTLRFDGDVFETEDQRNWTDASFKTYSTPQAMPVPVEIGTGTVIRQKVVVAVDGTTPARVGNILLPSVNLDDLFMNQGAVPRLGTRWVKKTPPDTGVIRRLECAGFSHLRTDVIMTDTAAGPQVEGMLGIARSAGCGLELAVHCTDAFDTELALLASILEQQDDVSLRILLHHTASVVTPETVAACAVRRFAGVKAQREIVAGTDRYFIEVNRTHVATGGIDGVCFSANPQVHTSDNRAVMENVQGLEECIRSAGMLYAGTPVVVSPLTMRPRKDPARPHKSGGADTRQKELFGAAWLTASIGACMSAGLPTLTLLAASGPEGMMSDDGSELFPVYHAVNSGISRAVSGSAVRLTSGETLFAAVAFTDGKNRAVLVANCSSAEDTVEVRGVREGTTVAVLDDTVADRARQDGGFWEHHRKEVAVSDGCCCSLKLRPYGVARMVVPL